MCTLAPPINNTLTALERLTEIFCQVDLYKFSTRREGLTFIITVELPGGVLERRHDEACKRVLDILNSLGLNPTFSKVREIIRYEWTLTG